MKSHIRRQFIEEQKLKNLKIQKTKHMLIRVDC
jgi:hypothetical protein